MTVANLALLAGFGICFMLLGCRAPTHPRDDGVPDRRQLVTDRFVFSYANIDDSVIRALADAGEPAAARVLGELGAELMAPVRVTLYESHVAMADAVRPIVGPISQSVLGLVTSAQDIHMLRPLDGTPTHIDASAGILAHEFTHCVTLRMNASMGNNPRWLWEAVAVYGARQQGNAALLASTLSGTAPTLAQLNNVDSPLIYDLGFSLSEFTIARGGLVAIRELIRTNGDTQLVLGLEPAEFTPAWLNWARARQ